MGKVATVGIGLITVSAIAVAAGFILLNDENLLGTEPVEPQPNYQLIEASACCGANINQMTVGIKNTGTGELIINEITLLWGTLNLESVPIIIPAGETQTLLFKPNGLIALTKENDLTVTIKFNTNETLVITNSDLTYE